MFWLWTWSLHIEMHQAAKNLQIAQHILLHDLSWETQELNVNLLQVKTLLSISSRAYGPSLLDSQCTFCGGRSRTGIKWFIMPKYLYKLKFELVSSNSPLFCLYSLPKMETLCQLHSGVSHVAYPTPLIAWRNYWAVHFLIFWKIYVEAGTWILSFVRLKYVVKSMKYLGVVRLLPLPYVSFPVMYISSPGSDRYATVPTSNRSDTPRGKM